MHGALSGLCRASDQVRVRVFFWILIAASGAMAESNPSWWMLASPDATALVGIDWQNLKSSPFADAITDELGSSIGLPPLPCLTDANEILISSPPMLAIVTGNFKTATLRQEAAKLSMKPAVYQGIELWISPGNSTLSVAQFGEQMLLAGSIKTLQAAIDRSLGQTRRYSPLLERAARYSHADLWVVAGKLPDPLASVFVPLEVKTGGFEGYATVGDGLDIEASLDAGSEDAAAALAESLRQLIPEMPEIAQGLQVKVEARNVFLSLELDRDQFSAALRQPLAAPEAPKPVAVAPAAVTPVAATPVAATPAPPPEPAKPAGPQVIRIFGLDGGTREIVLPPVKPDKP